MCTHTCAADPLILSRYPPAKRQEFTTGVPSAKFRALIAEPRAKETRCAPAKRQEFTAAVPSNFALVRLGHHQLALGHSTRQLPRKGRVCNFRALTAEKRARRRAMRPPTS
jgi:hypothetical protein